MDRSEFVATRDDSLLLIIDIQEAMPRVIDRWEIVSSRTKQLIQSANVLDVPILFTEQYKKVLGETISELFQEIESLQVFQKEHLSACLEEEFIPTLQSFNREKIVVVGMETHVCVLQTCLDLIKAGFQVHLVADAVASRVDKNRDIAIDLLRQAGAVISSTEIVIFQWACRANTDAFRKILPIVK